MMNHTKLRQILKTCTVTLNSEPSGGIEAVVTEKKQQISFVENGRNMSDLLINIEKQLKKL